MTAPAIRSHKATGTVANPVVLIEGEEGAGKTTKMVELSRSKRTGQMYVIEIGETRVDEYGGLMADADVEVVDHDGSYQSILEQVVAVKAEAARAHAAGEPPVVLGIDSFTFLWEGLKTWLNTRARESSANQKILAQDPAAELKIGRHLWNDAESRYSRIQNQLLTFPGIVVVTARGKWVSMTDPSNGQPFRDGRKEYRVESHKSLPYAAGVWVRLTRDGDPEVVACKSGHVGIRYEKDARGREANNRALSTPKGADMLDHLIFDIIKYDAARATTDHLKVFTPGPLDASEIATDPDAAPQRPRIVPSASPIRSEGEADAAAAAVAVAAVSCADVEKIRATWQEANTRGLIGIDVGTAVTMDQAAVVGVTGTSPLTLGGWLKAVGTWVAANGGLSVADQLAAIDTPDTKADPEKVA